ncbi:MAG: class II aldolase/adducin family protein [Clostridia bacterium]|nr:class II aldolase/adducin family protein [Clostridia bacterium]
MNYKKMIVDTMNDIYSNSLTTSSGGNISLIDKDGNIFISPSGLDKGALREDLICIVDSNGNNLSKYKPSMELPFHSKIYRIRKDVAAVVHTHSPYLTAYSLIDGAPETKISYFHYKSNNSIAKAGYDIPGSIELGDKICKKIEEGYDSVMMRNHGAVVIGKNMPDTYRKMESLEHCASINVLAQSLGGVKTLTLEQLKSYQDKEENYSISDINEIVDEDIEKAVSELKQYANRCYNHEYFLSCMGVISVKVSGGMLITSRDCDRRDITNSGKYSGVTFIKDNKIYGEYPDMSWKLHLEIYKNSDMNSIFTALPKYIGAYIAARSDIDSRTLPESYIMMRQVLRYPALSDIENKEKIAKNITEVNPVAIIDNSCVVCGGKTINKAFDRLEVCEATAKAYYITKSIGKALNIEDKEIKKIEDYFNLPL